MVTAAVFATALDDAFSALQHVQGKERKAFSPGLLAGYAVALKLTWPTRGR
jgi:hypothetical protein